MLAAWAVERQRSADVVRGLAGGIIAFVLSKHFQGRADSCGSGVEKHSRKRPDMSYSAGWMGESRGGRAQYRCLGLAQQV